MRESRDFEESYDEFAGEGSPGTGGEEYPDTLTVDAAFSSLETIGDFVQQKATAAGLNFKRTWELMLAMDEVCSNIVAHTLPTDEDRRIRLVWAREETAVLIVLWDNGIAFNPLTVPTTEAEETEETRRLGGMGSYLVEEMVDGIAYERKDNMNCLTIRKLLRKGRNGRQNGKNSERSNGKHAARSPRTHAHGGAA